MKCPHCLVEFHSQLETFPLQKDSDGEWYINAYECPNSSCGKSTFILCNGETNYNGRVFVPWNEPTLTYMIRPKGSSRPPVPIEVPKNIAIDYLEACVVLSDSSKASAALSRRCLQNLLIDKAGVKKGDLSTQIQNVIDSGKLPTHLESDIDAIRNIGNFAAHPNKSISTGEILEVEPNEAQWNLEVLEALFDFYYVQPEKARIRREALNIKLIDSGKPPMK